MGKAASLTRRAASAVMIGSALALGTSLPALAASTDAGHAGDTAKQQQTDGAGDLQKPENSTTKSSDTSKNKETTKSTDTKSSDTKSKDTEGTDTKSTDTSKSTDTKSSDASKSKDTESSDTSKSTDTKGTEGTDASSSDATHVALCHRTGSSTNPYVLIDPSAAGAYHGHYLEHTGGLPAPGQPAIDDGDIIPPFLYKGTIYSLNFPAGKYIFEDGCKVPATASNGGTTASNGGTTGGTTASNGGTTGGAPVTTRAGGGTAPTTVLASRPVTTRAGSGTAPTATTTTVPPGVTLAAGGFAPLAGGVAPESSNGIGSTGLPITRAAGGTAGAGTTTGAAAAASLAAGESSSGQLPFTGADSTDLALAAVGLLGLGAGLIAVGRRPSARG